MENVRAQDIGDIKNNISSIIQFNGLRLKHRSYKMQLKNIVSIFNTNISNLSLQNTGCGYSSLFCCWNSMSGIQGVSHAL